MLMELKARKVEREEQPIEVGGINIQNIPSHSKNIRLLFKASTKNHKVEISDDGYYEIPETDQVQTTAGGNWADDSPIGDILLGDETQEPLINKVKPGKNYLVYVQQIERKDQIFN